MTKKEICQNNATIAYCSGFGGIEVKHIEHGTEDYLYIVAGAWNGSRTYHKLKVHYGKYNYILFHGQRCRLNEFIRS